MEIVSEFAHEKWLNNLVVKQDAFGQTLELLAVALVRIDDRELLFEFIEHFTILDLERAHYIFTSDYQVHDARYDHPLAVFSAFIADGNYVDELHEGEELLMTFRISLKELQLKLVLQIRKRLIDILVPPFHEPLCPFKMRLELVEIPAQKFTSFVFLTNYLVNSDRVVCALRKRLNVRWIYLLVLGSHMKASDSDELEILCLDMLVASLKISVDVLQSQMKGLPLQAVI